MEVQKNDFIELEFRAYITQTNELFDSTFSEDAKILKLKKENLKPIPVCVGKGMVIDGLDKALVGKEVGKEYEIEINPKEAFGERSASAVKMLPINSFDKNQLNNLRPGVQIYFQDGSAAKVVSVGGGRVLLDFNHPLAGKSTTYKIKIIKKIEKLEDKINALQDYFFRKRFKFEKKDGKIVFHQDKEFPINTPLQILNKEFSQLLGVSFEKLH